MPSSSGINATGVTNTGATGGSQIISTSPIGSVALASIGATTTDVIQLWLTEIFVPCNRFATKVGILQGGTALTDKLLAVIYDSSGALVGSSALAGTVVSGANTFLEFSLVLDGAGATVPGLQLFGPGQYFVGCQGSGTSVGVLQTYAAPYMMACNSAAAGIFGTLPAQIAVPTAFTTGKGPICYIK